VFQTCFRPVSDHFFQPRRRKQILEKQSQPKKERKQMIEKDG